MSVCVGRELMEWKKGERTGKWFGCKSQVLGTSANGCLSEWASVSSE